MSAFGFFETSDSYGIIMDDFMVTRFVLQGFSRIWNFFFNFHLQVVHDENTLSTTFGTPCTN